MLKINKFVFLNTSILTDYGSFCYLKKTADEIRELLQKHKDKPRLSAIGYKPIAEMMSTIIGEDVMVSDIQYCLGAFDCAVVFKVNGRYKAGSPMEKEDIEKRGYELGIIY